MSDGLSDKLSATNKIIKGAPGRPGAAKPAQAERVLERLRRAQRLYVEEWVHVIHELRPELNDAGVRALVHGVLGLLQSPSDFQSGLADEGVMNLLMSMAVAAVFQASTDSLDFPALAAKSRSAVRSA